MREFDFADWNWTAESRMVILTGAGVSADSGIPTFRDSGGLWENHRVEEVATPEAYHRNPELVVNFYNERRKKLKGVQPNPAHEALGKLEELLGDRLYLVTQNVDDLHERGGSRRVIHMHGELLQLRCRQLHRVSFDGEQEVDEACPECDDRLRPDIVWFGEMPYHMDEIYRELGRCTHFVYIGTSSQVYPAAGFKDVVAKKGAKVLCLNLDVEFMDPATDYYIQGRAAEVVPRFAKCYL